MKLTHYLHIKDNTNDFKNSEIIQRNKREMCFAEEENAELRKFKYHWYVNMERHFNAFSSHQAVRDREQMVL